MIGCVWSELMFMCAFNILTYDELLYRNKIEILNLYSQLLSTAAVPIK